MQRVALARALVIEPRVLLLDEPTANLDPYNVGLIEEIIRGQNARHGTTSVIVTHNVFQAKRLAHRVGLMLSGSLIELADTATFFNKPSDPRTAAFVRGRWCISGQESGVKGQESGGSGRPSSAIRLSSFVV